MFEDEDHYFLYERWGQACYFVFIIWTAMQWAAMGSGESKIRDRQKIGQNWTKKLKFGGN
jgi:hypothetical protein